MKNLTQSVVIIAFVFVIGFASAAMLIPTPRSDGSPSLTGAMIQQLPCMDVTGCVETEVSIDQTNIYLRSGCFRLAVTTNELQTYSIHSGMQGIRGPRPTTHDIIEDMLETFGLEPLIVKIEKLEQGTYFATIAFTQGTKVLNMDIRPSDAVAIAVRTNTPIWVNQSLLEGYGEFIC
jgi:bifunctional DNase/RNase